MTTSPNMNLPISTIGVDTGLAWETNLNGALGAIDSHDHSSGQGVPVTPDGINISSEFKINGNSLTGVQAIAFTTQVSLATLSAIYSKGVDLYFNDANGNAIQITKSGSVNATSSGISDGTATASFAAGVLVVNAAALTPANIQGASLLLGNNSPSTHFVTLSPPAALASDYTLTLPLKPASTKIMTLDSAGNMGAALDVTGSSLQSLQIASNQIGIIAQGVQQSALALRTVTTNGSDPGAGGVSTSGNFSANVAFTSFDQIAATTLTTLGRPVVIELIAGGTSSTSGQYHLTTANAVNFRVTGSGTNLVLTSQYASASIPTPVSTLRWIYFPAAGTYTFSFQGQIPSGGNIQITDAVLVAYEM